MFSVSRTRQYARLPLVMLGLLVMAGAASFVLWGRLSSRQVKASAPPVIAAGELPTLRGDDAIKQLKQQGLYSSLDEAVARIRYDLQRAEGKDLPARLKFDGEVWQAANPAQKLNTYFSRSGVQVAERGAEKTGGEFGLRVTSYGYGEQEIELGLGEMRTEGNRIEYTRPVINGKDSSLKEWYINSPEGVEQGFTLDTAPGAKPEGEALRVRMAVVGGWRAELAEGGQAVMLAGKQGERLRYAKLVAWDANLKPLKAWMEVAGQEVRLAVDDTNAIYPVTIDPTLSQQAKLIASNGAAGDRLGTSVAISGATVVVGADGDDVGANTNQGSAYVFVRAGSSWLFQEQLTAGDGKAFDLFGTSVAISGETIVVGAPQSGAGNGAAYVFVRAGTNWTPQQKLFAGDGEFDDRFGVSVGISGETIVAGSYLDNVTFNNQGSAYVFVRSGTNWTPQQKLTVSDGAFNDGLGLSVAIHDETIVVGAYRDDVNSTDQGSAYVFTRAGTMWTLQQKLLAADGEASDEFGNAVAISGETIVIGAHNGSLGTPNQCSFVGACKEGAAYVFARSGNAWTLQQRLAAVNGTASDEFGISVAISGEMIAVGAYYDASSAGTAYVFTRRGTSWEQQIQPLLATDGAGGDQLGISVAIADGTVVAGANGDRIGTNANQGSAYIFTCTGETWAEQTKFRGSDGRAFGYSVAINGETAVVGAYEDDNRQGSAYVFVRDGANWTLQERITASDGTEGDWFGYAVAISGETVVVGARRGDENSQRGAVYVFERSGTNWAQQQKIPSEFFEFGSSVAISGNTLVIGSPGEVGGRGAAYAFVRSVNNWAQQQKFSSGNPDVSHGFGTSVAISGETIVIGHPYEDIGTKVNQGSAHIFVRNGTIWSQQEKLTISDGAVSDYFGISVGISGNTLIVGASRDDVGTASDQGSAYVFGRNGARWTQQQQLTAIGGAAGDEFGISVAIDGEIIVVGAFGDTIGSNNRQGSAYVFRRSGANWTQTPRMTGSDGPTFSQFGYSVGISGETVVIGAPNISTGNYTIGSAYIFTPTSCSIGLRGPDLALTKTDGGASAIPGANVIYTLGYANVGGVNATGVMLTETVPANTTFNAASSSSGWTCTPNNNAGATCTLSIGSLAVGANGMKAFAVTVNSTVPAGVAQISNSASIADDGTHGVDPNLLNNRASEATPLNALPVLTLVKSDGGATVAPGGTVTYVLGYANIGNQGATGVMITETVPVNTTFNAAASTSGWSCTGSNCTFNVGALSSGGVGTVNFAVTVNATLPSGVTQISNTASLKDDGANGTFPPVTASDTTPINIANRRPVANPDRKTTNEDTPITFPASDLTANDTDADRDPLTVTGVGAASNGTVSLAGGNVTFTPAANRHSPSTTFGFNYTISDGKGGMATGTVTVIVNAVNDAPVAVNDSYATNEDSVLTVSAPGVRANDTDAEASTLTAALVTGPIRGTLSFNADGSFRYTPVANFFGVVNFTYRVSDGTVNSNTATVTITVRAVNDPPDAVDDEAISNRNVPVTINVLANDSSASDVGETLRVTAVTQGALGAVTINPNGTVIYTPGVAFTGRDMFTYTLSDGNGGTDTAKVTVRGSHLLDPTPQSVSPGGTITIHWTVPAGSAALDWVGLFRVGDANTAYRTGFYTGGATSGSRNVTMPATPGQYEFRYFLNNSFTLVARSVVVTVGTPTCPTISRLSSTSGGIRSGVIITGEGFTGVTAVSFGGASATFLVIRDTLIIAIVPAGATTGPLTLSKAGCPAARSGVFTVISNYSLKATPASVRPAGSVTVNWTAPVGSSGRDWIGLYRTGDSPTEPMMRFFTDGAASGSRSVTMPASPGQYEFRYFLNNRYRLARASQPITVSAP